MKALKYSFPLVLFLLIVGLLGYGLTLHPAEVPSPLISQSVPKFELPTLFDAKKNMTNKDFIGQVTLLNVWASWCSICAEEHPFLMQLAKEHVVLYGMNYKDDTDTAKMLLKKYGNPYKLIAVDSTGVTAIDWGVYGTPETFLIDKKGVIRYKQIGMMTPEAWEKTIKPLVTQLWNEPT